MRVGWAGGIFTLLLVQARWVTPAFTFPLDLLHLMLDTTSLEEFGHDQRAFTDAVNWQTLRVSSTATPAPFVGCVDYTNGRKARIRLEGELGVEAVRTAHHSRDHEVSCFVFHALHEEAKRLLGEDETGDVPLKHLAAFPSNLKVSECT